MKKRVSFNSKKIRDLFFKEVLNSFYFKKWNQLSKKFQLNRNTLTDYRKAKLTLPLILYNRLSFKISKSKLKFFEKNISFLDENWGRIKGGRSAYLKNKIFFDEGRKKAIKLSRKRQHRFNINMPLNKELSYFLGLLIGDGFTNKYGRYYLTQLIGHLKYELGYYLKIVLPLTKKLFGILPSIKKYPKINTLRVNFYSKDLFLLITRRFGIPPGRKSSFVLISKKILNSEKSIFLSCIAGIYDAEGSFYLDKRKSYKNPYPILELHMSNKGIIQQISKTFLKFEISHYVRQESRIYIYGKKNLKTFLSQIKILNPKLVLKIDKYFS